MPTGRGESTLAPPRLIIYFSGLAVRPLIGESLALEAFQRFMRALTVCNLPRVIPKIELAQVPVKMLFADVMIHAIDAALEDLEVAFDGVRRHANAFFVSHVLIRLVIYQ